MLTQKKNLFEESDKALAANFLEAGFGFETEGGLLLHPLEAHYLAKIGKTSFAKKQKSSKDFPFAFAVYSQIRGIGRMVRPYMKETNFFRVYEPGVGREEKRPSQLICLLPGAIPSPKSLTEQIKTAHLARLDLIIACGTEKEIKYYKISAVKF
jgi:tRNA splicing endonuclease